MVWDLLGSGFIEDLEYLPYMILSGFMQVIQG